MKKLLLILILGLIVRGPLHCSQERPVLGGAS
jgi:hypothetical protein